MAGPLIAGVLEQHFGFKLSFCWFAQLAMVGALVFSWSVPETRTAAGMTIASAAAD